MKTDTNIVMTETDGTNEDVMKIAITLCLAGTVNAMAIITHHGAEQFVETAEELVARLVMTETIMMEKDVDLIVQGLFPVGTVKVGICMEEQIVILSVGMEGQ